MGMPVVRAEQLELPKKIEWFKDQALAAIPKTLAPCTNKVDLRS